MAAGCSFPYFGPAPTYAAATQRDSEGDRWRDWLDRISSGFLGRFTYLAEGRLADEPKVARAPHRTSVADNPSEDRSAGKVARSETFPGPYKREQRALADEPGSLQQRLARLKGMDEAAPEDRSDAVRLLLEGRLQSSQSEQQIAGRGAERTCLSLWLEDQPSETMEIHL